MRILDFSDGFETSTTPSVTNLSANSLKSFANDSAFVTDKGSAAAAGNIYFNSTYNTVRRYDGTDWLNLINGTGSALTANTIPYIDANKQLTSSAVTPTTLSYLDATSSVQTQLDAKAPLTSPTLVTPTLGVATATSLAMGEALDASSILDVASTTKGFLEPRMTQAQRDAIGTPATGLQIYNTDSNKLNYYNGTSWSEVGSGSAGINYITDYDGSAIGSWTTYADAAATSPVDGTGGSPSSTYAVSTDSSLRGTSNFLWTHSAANRQGEGFSYNFTINPADKGKVLQCSFEYLVASGTYADDDLQFWIYDVTNATLIQPAPYKLKNSGIIEKFAFEFQTSSSSTSYRLIGHVATSTATAYTIRFDNWNLGPQAKLYGSPITDVGGTYTPVVANGGTATFSTLTGNWRRVGDKAEISIVAIASGVGSGASAITFSLPSGLVGDSGKYLSGLTIGKATHYSLEAATQYDTSGIGLSSTTTINITNNGAGGNFTGADIRADTQIYITASIPIVGWSSSTVMSHDASTRVVAAIITGDPASASSGNPIIVPTVSYDSHGCYSNITGRYTVAVPGLYKMFGALQSASAATTLTIYKNAVSNQLCGNLDSNGEATFIGMVNCVAGDIIDIRPGGTVDATSMSLNIERVSGPVQIAASEVVAGDWYKNGNTTYNANAARQQILIDTANLDTHSMLSSNTVVIQTPGIYEIDAQAYFSGANIVSGGLYSVLVTKTTLGGTVLAGGESRAAAIGAVTTCTATGIRSLVTGDILYFAVSSNQNHSASTITVDGSTTFLTKVSVRRLGGI